MLSQVAVVPDDINPDDGAVTVLRMLIWMMVWSPYLGSCATGRKRAGWHGSIWKTLQ